LLLAKKIGLEELPVMLREINLEKMKEFFLKQSSKLVKSRIRP